MRKIMSVCSFCVLLATTGWTDEKTIEASQLNENIKVTGKLGIPLGTIVQINADVIVDDSSKGLKGELLLRIYKVNDKILERPICLKYEKINDEIIFKHNEKIKCIGFETGRFEGLPKDSFKYILPMTSAEFYFLTSFFVLKKQ